MAKKIFALRTIGGSMRPIIKSGKIILVYPVKKYAPGDIVAYNCGGRKLVHRLVGISADTATISDDGLVCDRHKINCSQITGKVAAPFYHHGICGLLFHFATRFLRKLLEHTRKAYSGF